MLCSNKLLWSANINHFMEDEVIVKGKVTISSETGVEINADFDADETKGMSAARLRIKAIRWAMNQLCIAMDKEINTLPLSECVTDDRIH